MVLGGYPVKVGMEQRNAALLMHTVKCMGAASNENAFLSVFFKTHTWL